MLPAESPTSWLESLLLPLAAIVFCLEGVLRIASIDRGTPGLGLVVHALLMVALFVAFALPVGAALGALAVGCQRWLAARRNGAAIALAGAAVIASGAAGIFVNLGRQTPAWHVTTVAVLWTGLLAMKMFLVCHRFAASWFAAKNHAER